MTPSPSDPGATNYPAAAPADAAAPGGPPPVDPGVTRYPPPATPDDGATRYGATPGPASGSGPGGVPAGLGGFGDYEVVRRIDKGGMGVVYLARHRKTGHEVALKMILAAELAGP